VSLKAEQQYQTVLPPVAGAFAAVNCSTTPTVVDLTSLPADPAAQGGGDPGEKNPIGKYVRVTADGGSIYFVTGSNINALNAIPNTAIYSTVNATTGAVTVSGNELDVIPAGTFKDVFVVAGATPQTEFPPGKSSPSRYIAFMTASGSAVARFGQASP